MSKPVTMTKEEASAKVIEIEAQGFEHRGGFGVVCSSAGDEWGHTWENATELVTIEWLEKKSGEVIARMWRKPRS